VHGRRMLDTPCHVICLPNSEHVSAHGSGLSHARCLGLGAVLEGELRRADRPRQAFILEMLEGVLTCSSVSLLEMLDGVRIADMLEGMCLAPPHTYLKR